MPIDRTAGPAMTLLQQMEDLAQFEEGPNRP